MSLCPSLSPCVFAKDKGIPSKNHNTRIHVRKREVGRFLLCTPKRDRGLRNIPGGKLLLLELHPRGFSLVSFVTLTLSESRPVAWQRVPGTGIPWAFPPCLTQVRQQFLRLPEPLSPQAPGEREFTQNIFHKPAARGTPRTTKHKRVGPSQYQSRGEGMWRLEFPHQASALEEGLP